MSAAEAAREEPPRIRTIGDAEFAAEVLHCPLPVLVDFRVADCRLCRLLEPLLEELAATYVSSLRVVFVDADANPVAAQRFQVSSVPTLILFADGGERRRRTGALPRPLLELWLRRALVS